MHVLVYAFVSSGGGGGGGGAGGGGAGGGGAVAYLRKNGCANPGCLT